MSALWTGDLDLAFSFRYADHYTTLTAAIELVRLPLIPALLMLTEKSFYLIFLLQKPQPFF